MKASGVLLGRRGIHLTGRCVFRTSNSAPFVELTSPSTSTTLAKSGRTPPSSLRGNSYFTSRFAGQSSSDSSASRNVVFHGGDLVITQESSVAAENLRHQRIVDVTGLQTSYVNASERSRQAMATVDEVIQSMHLHDGGEIPQLERGSAPLGRLLVQCVVSSSSSPIAVARLHSALCPVENAGLKLLGTNDLSFTSEGQALQWARIMAERCSHALRSASSMRGVTLMPVVRDHRIVALRFV